MYVFTAFSFESQHLFLYPLVIYARIFLSWWFARSRMIGKPRHGRRSPWMSSMVVGRDRQLEAKFIGSGRCMWGAGAQGGKGTCGPGIRRALGAAHSIPASPPSSLALPSIYPNSRLHVLLLLSYCCLVHFASSHFNSFATNVFFNLYWLFTFWYLDISRHVYFSNIIKIHPSFWTFLSCIFKCLRPMCIFAVRSCVCIEVTYKGTRKFWF